MKNSTQNFILIFVSIIICFVIIEIVYRSYLSILKPITIYLPAAKTLNPGGSGEYRGGHVTLDENGLRNKIDEKALERKYRFLVVGDSVTFGMGVDDDEVFVHHLNTLYEKRDVGFVNLGVPGLGTEWLRVQLAKHHKRFAPYIGIIWVYNINDARSNEDYKELSDEVISDEYYSKGSNTIENYIWPYLKSPTLIKYLLKNLKDLMFKANARKNLQWEDYYEMCLQSYSPSSQKAMTEKRYIQQIIQWSQEAGIPLGFVLVPYTDQFEDRRLEPQKFIKNILNENNIPYLDLMQEIDNQQMPVEEYFLPDDHGHLNAEGHKLAAMSIARFIKKMFREE